MISRAQQSELGSETGRPNSARRSRQPPGTSLITGSFGQWWSDTEVNFVEIRRFNQRPLLSRSQIRQFLFMLI